MKNEELNDEVAIAVLEERAERADDALNDALARLNGCIRDAVSEHLWDWTKNGQMVDLVNQIAKDVVREAVKQEIRSQLEQPELKARIKDAVAAAMDTSVVEKIAREAASKVRLW